MANTKHNMTVLALLIVFICWRENSCATH